MTTLKVIFMAAAITGMLFIFPAAAQGKTSFGPVFAVYDGGSSQGTAVAAADVYIFGRPRDYQRHDVRRDRDWRDRDWRTSDRYMYTRDRYGRQWRFDRYTREWTLVPDYAWRYGRPYRDFEPIYGRPVQPKYGRDRYRDFRGGDWRDRDRDWRGRDRDRRERGRDWRWGD